MTVSRKTKLWSSLSAAALLGASTPAAADQDGAMAGHGVSQGPVMPAPDQVGEGEGGEGEGGEGEGEGIPGRQSGEAGIDAERALRDPVVYLIGLEVIRAHYLAGLAAFDAGETGPAGGMFSHPVGEVYLDLAPVFAELGVNPFGQMMRDTAALVFDGAEAHRVEASAEQVLKTVHKAAQKAPQADMDAGAVHAKVLADLIERASLQYRLALADGPEGDAYLDGFGYYRAARTHAERHLSSVRQRDEAAASAIADALAKLGDGFASVTPPDDFLAQPPVEAGAVLAASSQVMLRAGSL